MIRIVTGLPRANGIGEYVAHLARVVPAEVLYERPMTPEAYENTGGERPGWGRALRLARTLRRQPSEAIARSHVAWEGWGPIYGARTRLLTVHHVLGPTVPWRGPVGVRSRIVYAIARRGHRRTVRFGVRCVVPSASVRDDLVRLYGADPARVETVPHYLDPTTFTPLDRGEARHRLGLPGDGPILLHVGSDDLRKNVAGLLRAYRRLREAIPGLRLVHIGPSEAIAAATRAADGPSIVHRPSVPGADRPLWYAAADVIVAPTYLEGFGRVPLEALACGRRTVTSDLPVFREELGPWFRGAPPDDIEGFTTAVRDALGAPDEAEARHAYVVRAFPRERFESAYRALYRELDPSLS